MKRFRVAMILVVAVIVVCVIALALLFLPSFVAERSAVPFQSMEVTFQDDGGVATIHCDAFRVAFEGQSFGTSKRSGDYLVDGRYGFRLLAGPESVGDVRAGVAYEYSQRRRLLTFRYQGHEIAYSRALKQLIVDGREYSTAHGQVQLLLKGNGDVEPVGN